MIEFIFQHWLETLIALGAYISGIFTVYLKQRAKNKALLADNERLTNETEEIKKNHALDIQKRKYQYESKKEQFFNYFNMIDDFSTKSSQEFMNDFPPIVSKFNEELLSSHGNKELEIKAITNFSEQVNKFTFKANENLIKIKQETNCIKLIANQEIISLIEKMDVQFEKSLTLSSQLMDSISKMIIIKENTQVDELKKQLDLIGTTVLNLKNQLIKEVKKELDTI